MTPSAHLSSYSPRKLWAGTLALAAEISFGRNSPFECIISVHPSLEARLGSYPRTVGNCWREEFVPSSQCLAFLKDLLPS